MWRRTRRPELRGGRRTTGHKGWSGRRSIAVGHRGYCFGPVGTSAYVVLVKWALLEERQVGTGNARSLYPKTLNRLLASENLDGEFRIVLAGKRTSVNECGWLSRSATD